MKGKVIITGASGGFGFLTSKLLAEQGYSVVGTMRSASGSREAVANDLREAGVQVVEMDVTSNDSVQQGTAEAIELLGGLDIVINNAGVGVLGMQEHFTPEDFQKLFEVNVFGVQRLMREVLPHFRNQRSGTAVFVSSLLGRMTLPFYGPYNASKWALEAMAENYRTELSGFGIESCIVEPGGFPTTFMANLLTPSDTSRIDVYGAFMDAPKMMFDGFEEALANTPEQRPEIVAEAIADLLAQPFGQRAFRTVVDHMGMGDHIGPYNDMLHNLTRGIYTAFGTDGMLEIKTE